MDETGVLNQNDDFPSKNETKRGVQTVRMKSAKQKKLFNY